MSYLLDTDIVSAFNKQTISPKLVRWLQRHEAESFISVVALAEMRHGLETAPASHHDELARRLDATARKFAESFVPLDVEVLVRWKSLLRQLKLINRTMTCEDSLLAATCLARDHTMATNNVRHFAPAREFGLRIVNPLE